MDITNIGIVLIFLSVVIAALPESPFASVIAMLRGSEIFSMLGYFIPFVQIVALMELWVAAIAVYYGVSLLARWIKLIA